MINIGKACKIARRAAVDPFIAMDVLAAANAKAASGKDVIHMEVGEPGGPPPRVLAAAKRALDHRPLGYTEALGRPALRCAIADHYRRWYQTDLDPRRVVVTTGASGGFILTFLSAFDAGDRVIVPEPAFPAYKNILRALDIDVVTLPLGPDTEFKPTTALLEAIPGPIHGLIVASPGNPTGTMLSGPEMQALTSYCAQSRIRLISDEIYHGISYGERAHSALEYAPDTIVINGFSKYFCMTGWRLGWTILPDDMVRSVELLAQNLFISAPTLAQEAALASFDCYAELDLRLEAYRVNRNVLLTQLPAAGLTRFAPADGAFYLYADVSAITADSFDFCKRLLDDTGVAIAPGADFDRTSGSNYVRFALCGDSERVAEGVSRFVCWLADQ